MICNNCRNGLSYEEKQFCIAKPTPREITADINRCIDYKERPNFKEIGEEILMRG